MADLQGPHFLGNDFDTFLDLLKKEREPEEMFTEEVAEVSNRKCQNNIEKCQNNDMCTLVR